VSALHDASPALDALVVAFFPRLGLGGIMQVLWEVGGGEMMKSIGHFVGQRVAYLVGLPDGSGSESANDFRLIIEVMLRGLLALLLTIRLVFFIDAFLLVLLLVKPL
jgi:hypothetical protein